jgi:alpha/beta superfamily hydrolase
MKKLLITLACALIAGGSFAQSITGDWYGALNIGNHPFRLTFHISKTGDGYTTLMDSPDQGGFGLATDKTTFIANKIVIEAGQYGISYTGTFLPDSNKIVGKQNPNMPLVLTHTPIASVHPVRPQDPKDFPYKQEEVTFTNPKGGNQLAGTLTTPSNGKFSKIVVLITGSGPQNRNEELMNHRPFLVWSDWLTRHGIAVLRYDDRGTFKSTGYFDQATTADFANDAEAAVSYIKSRPDLNQAAIGLMGHSEGGMIAPMVASRNKAVKFVVMLAGPGVAIDQLMLKQNADQLQLMGGTPDAIKSTTDINIKIYTAVKDNQSLPAQAFGVKLDTLFRQIIRALPKDQQTQINIDDFAKSQAAKINTPWMRYFLVANPADYLTRVNCPLLAINGSLDKQVNSIANLAAIKADMQIAGNKNYETVELEGLNHLFQKVSTGAVAEYEQTAETVNPAALQKVLDWIAMLKI